MSILTNDERAEIGMPPSEWRTASDICTSYGDFRERRYDCADWRIALQPIGPSVRREEFNGERVYQSFRAYRNGAPGVIEFNSFCPSFGHASNGGASWTPD